MIDFGFASAIFGKPLMGRSAIALICLGSLILRVSESGLAEDQPALDGQPPICSPATARTFLPKGVCEAKPLGNGRHEVKINLVPQSAKISVGGYEVTTENYNGSYLTPIVQANPGDVVAARVTNVLPHRTHPHSTHDGDENPTNLHYFHGGIVTPNNARPKAAEEGNGDNIYAHIAARHPRQPSGRQGVHGDRATNNVKEFWVPIPGKGELDGRVFELREGMYIEHPSGLNWYHSHLHGISSDQVMGGMSGMLTVGKDTANVGAACLHSEGSTKCTNDVAGDTAMLKRVTDVRYVLLRDLRLKDLKQRPDEANGGAPATWNPDPVKFPANALCGAWDPTKSKLVEDIRLRQGFCQPDLASAWLFTLNGQRYPTVTVNAGKNLLLRLANVSANVGYWLELIKQEDLGKPDPMRKNLSILSVDGVVPTSPVASDGAFTPILAAAPPSSLSDLTVCTRHRLSLWN
jgi:FtsP/CotA-like multicopper oxidase with cupredoxin domain